MTTNIKKLREQLNLSLEDVGLYLGVNRSRVHHFESGLSEESGENLEKVQKLMALVKKHKASRDVNPWVDRKLQQLEARDWRDEKRRANKIRSKELTRALEEMKSNYDNALKSLDIMAAIVKDPTCPKEVRRWLNSVSTRAAKMAMKNNPVEQMKIAMRIVELGGGR